MAAALSPIVPLSLGFVAPQLASNLSGRIGKNSALYLSYCSITERRRLLFAIIMALVRQASPVLMGEQGGQSFQFNRRRPRQLEMLSQKGNDNQHGCHGIGPLLAIIERLSVPTVADGQ